MAELGREGGRFTEDERLKSVSAVQVHFRCGAEARKRKPGSGSQEAEGEAHSSSPLRGRNGALRALVAFPPCVIIEFKS